MPEPLVLCFVCEKIILTKNISYHTKVNLPVCDACRGYEAEAVKVEELLEGMADGFVCGCI